MWLFSCVLITKPGEGKRERRSIKETNKEGKMNIVLVVSFCLFGFSAPEILEDGREIVEPEHLFSLLEEKNYDEFNRLMAIENPKLTIPRDENDKSDPRYNRDLEHGDFLVSPAQKRSFQGRSAINFGKHPSYKWRNGIVPFTVDRNGFTAKEIRQIYDCTEQCNVMYNDCVRLTPYENITDEKQKRNYVVIMNGNGCWSYIGSQGGQQPMSLQSTGCLSCGTICHEFMHCIGFAHEHSRADRDHHITMRWENINPGWESQFNMANYDDFLLHLCYDLCSVMHYPRYHSDLCKPGKNAFDIKVPNDVNCSHVIGYAPALTKLDTEKVCKAYPKKK